MSGWPFFNVLAKTPKIKRTNLFVYWCFIKYSLSSGGREAVFFYELASIKKVLVRECDSWLMSGSWESFREKLSAEEVLDGCSLSLLHHHRTPPSSNTLRKTGRHKQHPSLCAEAVLRLWCQLYEVSWLWARPSVQQHPSLCTLVKREPIKLKKEHFKVTFNRIETCRQKQIVQCFFIYPPVTTYMEG